jgi:hypothetical protein
VNLPLDVHLHLMASFSLVKDTEEIIKNRSTYSSRRTESFINLVLLIQLLLWSKVWTSLFLNLVLL